MQARQIQDDNTQRTDTQRPNRIGSSSKMSATQESQKKTFGKSTREIPHHSQKASKWYPAEDEAQHKKVRYKSPPEPEQEIATRRTAGLSSGSRRLWRLEILCDQAIRVALKKYGPEHEIRQRHNWIAETSSFTFAEETIANR